MVFAYISSSISYICLDMRCAQIATHEGAICTAAAILVFDEEWSGEWVCEACHYPILTHVVTDIGGDIIAVFRNIVNEFLRRVLYCDVL